MRTGSSFFGRSAEQERHAFRHVIAAGLDSAPIREAIWKDLQSNQEDLISGIQRRVIVVEEVAVEYAAFQFADGSINIGRITVPFRGEPVTTPE